MCPYLQIAQDRICQLSLPKNPAELNRKRYAPISQFNLHIALGAIHKGYPIFRPMFDPLTYLYPIFWPIFGPFYLSLPIYILFLQTPLLTETWDILYGQPHIRLNLKIFL